MYTIGIATFEGVKSEAMKERRKNSSSEQKTEKFTQLCWKTEKGCGMILMSESGKMKEMSDWRILEKLS